MLREKHKLKLSISIHIFIQTLEDDILASTDWIYAILDLFESPCLGLYICKISDGLAK
jgi:hypothetical protein